MEICLLVSAGVGALGTAFCGSHDGTNSVAFTFNLDIGVLTSWSQLSGAPPDDILELKNRWKYRLINVFQLNAAWTTSYTRWKAKCLTEFFERTNSNAFWLFPGKMAENRLKRDFYVWYLWVLASPADKQADRSVVLQKRRVLIKGIFFGLTHPMNSTF